MILTCPSCATRYFADDRSIGEQGRTVRCGGCGHSWFVEPHLTLTDAPPLEPDPVPALTREHVERMRRSLREEGASSAAARYRAKQLERQRRERAKAALLAWGATGAALAATTTSAVAFREDVARIWPKAATAYAAVGLDVNLFGLEFADLKVEQAFDGPNPVLVVSGLVNNVARSERSAPPLRFSLRDAKTAEIQHVVARLPEGVVPAGAGVRFEVRIEDASPEAVDLEVSFASDADLEERPLVAEHSAAAMGGLLDDLRLSTGPAEPFGDSEEADASDDLRDLIGKG